MTCCAADITYMGLAARTPVIIQQIKDYDWFVMNDGGYVLSVVNLSDVKYYAWYRSER